MNVYELTLSRWTADGDNNDQIKWIEAQSEEQLKLWIENSLDYPAEWGRPSAIRQLDDYSARNVQGIDFTISPQSFSVRTMLVSDLQDLVDACQSVLPYNHPALVNARATLERAKL